MASITLAMPRENHHKWVQKSEIDVSTGNNSRSRHLIKTQNLWQCFLIHTVEKQKSWFHGLKTTFPALCAQSVMFESRVMLLASQRTPYDPYEKYVGPTV